MNFARRTASGVGCSVEAWESYVRNLITQPDGKFVLKDLVVANRDNQLAINQLKEILKYNTKLLNQLEKLLLLV